MSADIEVGQTLGRFRIVSRLGEGGMGVVYKASDLRLDRTVAIKVLSTAAISNPDRRARFIQEAKAASALNHPGIIHVYDFDTAAGVDFIVMEYVAGETLDKRVRRSRLGVRELLVYGVQITDALSAAHAAGIIHRDIKPSNILIGDQGRVKILDFGLAKLIRLDSNHDLGSTRTSPPCTEEGAIVGTVAYMSPEQAEGKQLDVRSDIFSIGCVLYEMVTGRSPFQRESRASTLSAILRDEPQPISAAIREVPPQLEWIVNQCLRKDPNRRFQHIDDLKVALDALKEESDSPARVVGRFASTTRNRPIRRAATISAVLTAIIALVVVWSLNRRAELQRPILTRLTSDSGLTVDPAISPDGSLLAYASDRSGEGHLDIWVQQLAGGEPVRLTRDPADDREPSFSPDGTKIVFRSDRDGGGIYSISALGGQARLIAARGRGPRFSPDGSRMAFWAGMPYGDVHLGGTYVVRTDSGAPSRIGAARLGTAYNPIWSPDGTKLLVQGVAGPNPHAEPPDWWVVSLEDPSSQELTSTGARDLLRRLGLFSARPSAWLARNLILFSATSGDTTNIWQIPISPETWKVTGGPTQLTFGAGLESQAAQVLAPESGNSEEPRRLVFSLLHENVDIWALSMDPNGRKGRGPVRRLTQRATAEAFPVLSHDGRRLFFTSGPDGSSDIWRKDLDGSDVESAVTTTPFQEARPVVTTDGSRVAYEAVREQMRSCHVASVATMPAGGTAPPLPRALPANCARAWSWWPDGTKLLYLVFDKTDRVDVVDLTSGKAQTLLQSPTVDVYQAYLSPDGRWITFVGVHGTAPRTGQVFVAPLRGEAVASEDGWIAVTDRTAWSDKPRWSRDGAMLYFTSNQDGFQCIWAQELNPITKRPVRTPVAIYHSHSARLSILNVKLGPLEIAVGPDSLVFPMGEVTGNIWMTTLQHAE